MVGKRERMLRKLAMKRVRGVARGRARVKRTRKQERLGSIVTPRKLIKAIKGTGGVVALIAERLGRSYTTVTRLLKRTNDPVWRTAISRYFAERERVKDLAENCLFVTLTDESCERALRVKVAQYVLDRLARDRGYGEKHDSEILVRQQASMVVDVQIDSLSTRAKRELLQALESNGAFGQEDRKLLTSGDSDSRYETIDVEAREIQSSGANGNDTVKRATKRKRKPKPGNPNGRNVRRESVG